MFTNFFNGYKSAVHVRDVASGRVQDDSVNLTPESTWGANNPEMPSEWNGSSEDWQKIVDANPYSYENFVSAYGSSPTWLEEVGDLFGIRSNYDKARAEYVLKYNQYLADAVASKHTEDYNSDLAQVERQRAAGLNPDLAGQVDGSSTAGMASVAQSAGGVESMNDIPNYQTLFEGISSVIQTAASVCSCFPELQGMEIANVGAMTDFIKNNSADFASIESIANLFTPDELSELASSGSISDEKLESAIVRANDDAFSGYFSSRKSRRSVRKLADRYLRSAKYKNEVSDELAKFAKNMLGNAGNADYVTENDFGKMLQPPLKILEEFYKDLNSSRAKIEKTQTSTAQIAANTENDITRIQSGTVPDIVQGEKDYQAAQAKVMSMISDWVSDVFDDPKVKPFWKVSAAGIAGLIQNTVRSVSLNDLLGNLPSVNVRDSHDYNQYDDYSNNDSTRNTIINSR